MTFGTILLLVAGWVVWAIFRDHFAGGAGGRALPSVTRHKVSREIATPGFARSQLINDIVN